MSELREKIEAVLHNPVLANAATITEDGKPWTRYVMITTSENLEIRFATFVNARKVRQLEKNPEIHLTCGVNDPMEMAPYLQIQGKAKLTTDQEERHSLWSVILEDIFQGPDDPNYGVIKVIPYRIEYIAPGKMEPEVWEA